MTAAERHVWRPLNRPHLGVANAISDQIRAEEWRSPGLLTATARGSWLLVVGDYGGDHDTSRFHSLSFLVADLAYLWYWDERRREIRDLGDLGARRLSYKKLGSDTKRAKALVPFLRACNSIPGLLITFLVDKRISSIFTVDLDVHEVPLVVATDQWKPIVFEKLMRIAHLSSLAISGMVGCGQNILWVSDQDEIVPNEGRHRDACKLFGHILNHYLNCDVGKMQFATTQSDDGSLDLEDAAAIPDLAAGALSELVTSMAASCGSDTHGVLVPMKRDIPTKCQAISAWLADNSYTLKKLSFVVDYVHPDRFKAKMLKMEVDGPLAVYNPFLPNSGQ